MSSQNSSCPDPHEVAAKLLRQRVVPLLTTIDEKVAEMVIAQLLFLEQQDPVTPATVYIDSPGGDVSGALAIHDVLRQLKCPVHTLALTSCAGMATLLLAHGAPGSRSCFLDTRIILVPFEGGHNIARETASAELLRVEETCIRLMLEDTSLSSSELEQAFAAGRTFTAEEALRAGIIDRVFQRPGSDKVG